MIESEGMIPLCCYGGVECDGGSGGNDGDDGGGDIDGRCGSDDYDHHHD